MLMHKVCVVFPSVQATKKSQDHPAGQEHNVVWCLYMCSGSVVHYCETWNIDASSIPLNYIRQSCRWNVSRRNMQTWFIRTMAFITNMKFHTRETTEQRGHWYSCKHCNLKTRYDRIATTLCFKTKGKRSRSNALLQLLYRFKRQQKVDEVRMREMVETQVVMDWRCHTS